MSWAWWCSFVVSALEGVEVGRLGLSRLALATWGLVSITFLPQRENKLAEEPGSLFDIFYHEKTLLSDE